MDKSKRTIQESLVETARNILAEGLGPDFWYDADQGSDDEAGHYVQDPNYRPPDPSSVTPPGYGRLLRPLGNQQGVHLGYDKFHGSRPRLGGTPADRLRGWGYRGPNARYPVGGWGLVSYGPNTLPQYHWFYWDERTHQYVQTDSVRPHGNQYRNPGDWYFDTGTYRDIGGRQVWDPVWQQYKPGGRGRDIGRVRNNDEYSTEDWYNPATWPNPFPYFE